MRKKRRCKATDSGGRRCVKNRHRKGSFHKSEEPHTGKMAETYRATWVRLWK